MEDHRFDYLKLKGIKLPEFKNHAEAVLFVLKVMKEGMMGTQRIINIILENQERSFHSLQYHILLVAKEVDIDTKKLEDETRKYMDDNWKGLKQLANDHDSIRRQIDDIFKDK